MSKIEWWGSDEIALREKVITVDFPHVIVTQQFSIEQLERLFKLTTILKKEIKKKAKKDWLHGCILADLFYEPSTRTRFSFETAALRLGADYIFSENAAQFSSAIKGETLEDTIRIIADKADVIVLRHKENDSSVRASRKRFNLDVPVINGGAGEDQHPTQALLDLFTVVERFGQLKGLKVGIAGDLKRGRASRSLVYLLSKYPWVELFLIAPEVAQMGQDVLDHLTEVGMKWHQCETLKEIAHLLDVLYMTRFQAERGDPESKDLMAQASQVNIVDLALVEQMEEDAIIMHPLPRVNEIRYEVDKNPRARYFQQARNGDYIRMALLLCQLNPQKAQELLES